MSEKEVFVSPDTSRVLMSDILDGRVEDFTLQETQDKTLTVAFKFNDEEHFVGTLLVYYESDETSEMSVKMLLDDALSIIRKFRTRKFTQQLTFSVIQGEDDVFSSRETLFVVKGVGIDEISCEDGVCVVTVKFSQ